MEISFHHDMIFNKSDEKVKRQNKWQRKIARGHTDREKEILVVAYANALQ